MPATAERAAPRLEQGAREVETLESLRADTYALMERYARFMQQIIDERDVLKLQLGGEIDVE